MAMSQVRLPIPSLVGGISKQPSHLRFPNQVSDAQNVFFDPAEGASKRPPSRHLTAVTGLTTNGSYRVHLITRDQDERYLVIYGDGGDIEAWEIRDDETLRKATITADSNATTYMQSGTPTADQMRLVTVADTTMIANTTVATGTTDSGSYEVGRTYGNRTDMLSDTPANQTYARVGSDDDVKFYQYTPPGGATFATALGHLLVGSRARPNGSVWARTDKQPLKFTVEFQRVAMTLSGATWNESAKTLTKTGAFSSYTFREGDQINVTAGTNVDRKWYKIVSKTNNALTLDSSIVSSGNPTDVSTDGIGTSIPVSLHLLVQEPSMYAIARLMQDAIQNGGAENALVSWRPAPADGGGRFLITSPYRGSNTKVAVVEPGSGSGAGTDLTQQNQAFGTGNVTSTDGTGTPETDTLPSPERWTQVHPPDQVGGLPDQTKMPAVLTRTVAPTPSSAATFTLKLQTWNARLTGSNETNPAPTLMADGLKVTDMIFHRDRLWLGGKERLVSSQAGDYFNFYIKDHLGITQADPIDVGVGGSEDEVSFIDFLSSFRDKLVIWTKSGHQFELTSLDALAPDTVHIQRSTSMKTMSVRPKELGLFLYFMADKKDSSALHEYFFDQGHTADSSVDVSSHVVGLLPTSIKTIAASANNGHVFVLPNGTGCREVFDYVSFWKDNKREVSSWSRWIFDAIYKIRDIAVDRNDVYLLVESNSPQAHWFERLSVGRQILQGQAL